MNEKLSATGSGVDKLIKLRREGMSTPAVIDEIYLVSLSRFPSDAERNQLIALLPAPGDKLEREVVEDIFWGLLSSREFLFNH